MSTAGSLWKDVSNGKGSKRRTGSDQNAYNEGWQRIFGKKEEEMFTLSNEMREEVESLIEMDMEAGEIASLLGLSEEQVREAYFKEVKENES